MIHPWSNAYFMSAYHNPENGADTAIAYYEHNSRALMYAHYTGGGGNCGAGLWQCDTIEVMNETGADPQGLELQLAMFNGTPHIAYIDRGAGGVTTVKLAYRVGLGGNCGPTVGVTGKTWRCVTVDDGAGGTQVLEHAALALDATGRAYVAYHNASTHSLMLATEKLAANTTFTKYYTPAAVSPEGQTTATYYIYNGNTVAMSGVGFEDTLLHQTVRTSAQPPHLPYVTNTCGGNLAVTNGGTRVELTGVSLAPNASCAVTVQVLAHQAGNWDDDPNPLVSNEVQDKAATGGNLAVLLGPLPSPEEENVIYLPLLVR